MSLLKSCSQKCISTVKDKGCLFSLYWGEVRLSFSLGTNHMVRHLPAVILTLFFKVRPHVKPSHPDKENQEYF